MDVARKNKVFFVSLGCPKNRVDTEVMLGQLAARGWEVAASADEAQLLVVNTCGFVEDARVESVDTILDLAQAKTDAAGAKRLVVAGCLTQAHADALAAELPEVDLLVGTGEVGRFGDLVAQLPALAVPRTPGPDPLSVAARRVVGRPGHNYGADSPRVLSTKPWTAYVKVAEGCSQRCAFCVIPRLRGPQRSRDRADVVREARGLAAGGVKELNLVAQDLTHYGADLAGGGRLVDLLRELVRVDGVHWIRLLYCYPHDFTDELIDLIAAEPRVARYVDMPLQHISARVLEIMRRRFSEAGTRALVRRMRERIDGLVLRTTFIVGHPGETEDDFRRLFDFLAESRFERVGVFKYSPEEGTAAARRPDQVPDELKEERYDRLMTLQRGISAELHEAMIGSEVELLVEGASSESDLLLEARTYGQAPEIDGLTYVGQGWAEPGSVVRAEVIDAGDYDLVARILE